MGDTDVFYVASYSVERDGWCVFERNTDGVTMRFHAGAFSEQQIAVSEAARLNNIAENK